MKTMNEIRTMLDADRAGYFKMRDDLRFDLNRLESIYMQHMMLDHTPAQTVEAYIADVGKEKAEALIATLINHAAWDGRISKAAAQWAQTVESSWDEEAAMKLGLYTDKIHKAHLNQLAEEMMKR